MYLRPEMVQDVFFLGVDSGVHVLAINIDPNVLVPLGMCAIQSPNGRDDILAARFRQHLGDDLEGLRELHDGVLVHPRQSVAEILDLLCHLNLCRASSRNLTMTFFKTL